MPYGNLLKKLAKEKKLTYIQISNKCKELGVEVSAKYLTQIVNNIKPPPSVERTKAIAKVLDVDERLLIIEGYLDKAPDVIIEIFNNIKKCSILFGLTGIENKIECKEFYELKEEATEVPIAEYLIEFLEPSNINFINNKEFTILGDLINFSVSAENLKVFKVSDNSMAPKLEKGDTVTLEIKDKYIDGELIGLKVKGNKDIIYGKIFYKNETITLIKEYGDSLAYNKADVQILGKVDKVIKQL